MASVLLLENSQHFATPGHCWFLCEMTSEERAKKLHKDHYPELGSPSDWLKQISIAARPIRSTTQIWVLTLHGYGISGLVL